MKKQRIKDAEDDVGKEAADDNNGTVHIDKGRQEPAAEVKDLQQADAELLKLNFAKEK